jgi:hypothetical protein
MPVTDSLVRECGAISIDHRSRSPEQLRLAMSAPTVLITDMAVLVGIFLLGFLAKMFPKDGRKAKQ